MYLKLCSNPVIVIAEIDSKLASLDFGLEKYKHLLIQKFTIFYMLTFSSN